MYCSGRAVRVLLLVVVGLPTTVVRYMYILDLVLDLVGLLLL